MPDNATTDAFDPSVMPSARGARLKERRMLLGGVPAYALLVTGAAICILSALGLGLLA